MKKIIFTGGGSGGHVTLNLNLIPLFKESGWDIVYIGSKNGIEKDLIKKLTYVKYYAIETGKLRRYFSWENFKDALRVPVGVFQAWKIIHTEKPDIIFSKGGFVSFPVVLAGHLNRCPRIFMHESDVTPGLSNKMSLPFVTKFFTTFAETQNYVNQPKKVQYVGPVLSDRLENGDAENGRKLCGFDNQLPVIMFVGGSLGAKSINEAVRQNLDALCQNYQVIHICGRGQTDHTIHQNYRQFDFVDKEFKDLLALSEVVISRSGSNAIFELLSQKKPMLLVPLPSTSSRGEQTLNAVSFQKQGFAEILKDEDLHKENKLTNCINTVFLNKMSYIENMSKASLKQTSNQKLFEDIVNG